MKKIVFCDIDGTILDSLRGMNEISPKTKKAFEQLRAEHYFVIASGRSKCMIPKSILDLKPNGFICANGAYAEFDGQIVHEQWFKTDELAMIRDYCVTKEHNYYFENQDIIYCNDINNSLHHRFNEAWNLGDIFTEKPRNPNEKIHIIMLACKQEKDCDDLKQSFDPYFDVRRHHGFPSFDINLYGNNKGDAVNKILNHLNIKPDDAYAFGDGLNDIEMLKAVKYGIAMGNAASSVKQIAYELTDDVLDDGLYKALLRHQLVSKIA